MLNNIGLRDRIWDANIPKTVYINNFTINIQNDGESSTPNIEFFDSPYTELFPHIINRADRELNIEQQLEEMNS